MLYEVKNGTVSLGANEILSHFNFRMLDNEKIGIVGRNGAGKTTLLRLMNADVGLDYNDDGTMGEVVKSKDYNPQILRQQEVSNDTAYKYLLSAFKNLIDMEIKIEKITEELSSNYNEKKANDLNILIDSYNYEGGETYIKELKTGFRKFGFSELDLEKTMNQFSGGQTTKIALLKLLLSKPQVLLLDEPTNHLDIEAIEWMENYLKNYKKNVIIVSHDRMFLDNICNVIYDIENKLATRYEGNYTDFVMQKKINYELKLAEFNKNIKEIERLTKLADRFRYKATKAKMVQSKDKIIEKLEKNTINPVAADTKTFHIKIVPKKIGGKEVLRCSNLVVGYNLNANSKVSDVNNNVVESEANHHFVVSDVNHHFVGAKHCEPASTNLIAKINLTISRGDRIGVIGANGTGKSTFIKTIVGVIPKISGEIEFGHEIEYEYFDQRIAENNSTETLFNDFSNEFPTYTNTEVRNRLGRFLFGEDDIDKKVCNLSGGEKVRLCLAKIFERRPNLLILDEPTNHLDIIGKESLEEILDSFEGTVILVSHDRYFVKKIANKILYFEKNSEAVVGANANAVGANACGALMLPSQVHFFEYGYEDYEKYIKSIDESNPVGANADIVGANADSDYVGANADPVRANSVSPNADAVGANADSDFVGANACGARSILDNSMSKSNNDNHKKISSRDSYQLNKQKSKDQKKLKKIEEDIEKIESEISILQNQLLDEKIQSDFEKLTSINDKITNLNNDLISKYDEWESLSD